VAQWAHAIWKDQFLSYGQDGELIPTFATYAIPLGGVNADSAADITHVTTIYDIVMTATVTLDALGKSYYDGPWFTDLFPTFSIDVDVPRFGLQPSTWPFGNHETHAIASGGFWLSSVPTPTDTATGFATQTMVWQAHGRTEGRRTLPGPAGMEILASVSINYDSFGAGYPSSSPPVQWRWQGYMKSLFGSASTIS